MTSLLLETRKYWITQSMQCTGFTAARSPARSCANCAASRQQETERKNGKMAPVIPCQLATKEITPAEEAVEAEEAGSCQQKNSWAGLVRLGKMNWKMNRNAQAGLATPGLSAAWRIPGHDVRRLRVQRLFSWSAPTAVPTNS